MAVRIDASGDKIYRTANLPNRSNFTISGWGYRHTNRASQYQYFVGMEDATSNASAWALAGWLDTGTWHVSTSSGYQTGTGPGLTTWFYWFLRCDNSTTPDTYTLGWKTSGGSWTTIAVTYDLTFTPAWFVLGNDSYDEWSDISLERVRVWDAALTTTELDSEMVSPTPVRTSNIRTNWPLIVHTDLSDTVNGYNLTAGGTLSTYTPGPPLPYAVSVSDSATVSESVTASVSGGVSNRTISVSDSATVAESVVAQMAAALSASKSDAATVSESVTVTVLAAGARAVSVSDAATVGETVAAQMAAALRLSVSDSATVGESVTVVRQAAVTPLSVSVSDAITTADSGIGAPLGGACIGGVLTVDSTNGRYFRNNAGTLVLSGFHTWYEFYDGSTSYPPTGINYNTWLDYLDTRGVNYHKLWMPETAKQWADADHYFLPLPYQRTGPGNAADGMLKFDLTKFNQEYFDRLRQRAILAGNRGHYVVVKFFEGWQIDIHGYYYYPFDYHWFNAANNINGIDGDTDDDRNGEETRDLANTAIIAYQQAYIEKVVDTLNDLDNVLWEISNEDVSTSQPWQYHWIGHIHTYEDGKAKQHPVGMSSTFHAVGDSELYAGNAEWIAGSAAFPSNMTAVDGTKVYLYDTDHVMGLTSEHRWVWRSFCRGYNPIYMDEYDGALYGTDRRTDATYERIRYNLGKVLDYAALLDLAHMTPQNSLSDTGYCLAKTAGAAQLVAYQDASGALTVNLTGISGTFNVEWLRTAATTPTSQSGGTVSGGASRVLTPPWAGEDVMVYLWQSTYTVSVTDSATVGESVTARIAAALQVSVSDAATVGESVTVQVAAVATRTVSVSDATTVAESVTAQMAALAATATDSATVGESVAAAMGAALAVSVSDAATVGESVTVIRTVAGQMYVNVADAITATDAPTVGALALPGVTVTDAATLAESVAAALAPAGVSVTDSAAVAESVTVTVQAQGTLLVSVGDGAAVDDTAATAPLGLVGVSVSDGATLAEQVQVVALEAGAIQISVTDTIGIVETCGGAMALPGVSVVESITVAELIVAYMMGAAHADWTTGTAAVWGWTVGDAAVNKWTVSDRSKS